MHNIHVLIHLFCFIKSHCDTQNRCVKMYFWIRIHECNVMQCNAIAKALDFECRSLKVQLSNQIHIFFYLHSLKTYLPL